MLYLFLSLCLLAFCSVYFSRDFITSLFVASVLPPFLSLLSDKSILDSISGKEFIYYYVVLSLIGAYILVNQLLPVRRTTNINFWTTKPSTTLWRLFVALFVASIPLLRSYIGVSYLEFQDKSIVIASYSTYLYSLLGIILISYFACMPRYSALDLLILSLVFMLPTAGYLIAGFRSPFLSQLIVIASIAATISLTKVDKSNPFIVGFKFQKFNLLRSFRNIKSPILFLALAILSLIFAVPFISNLRAGANIGSYYSLPFSFLGEVSMGAFFSVEKLTKISSQNFTSFDFSCLLISPVKPPFIPESLWAPVINFLGITTSSCLAFSSTIASDLISHSGGFGSASSFYADAYYYFGQFSLIPIFLFYFLVLLSCRYVCNSFSSNSFTPFSLSLFILLVVYSPQLLTSWRQGIYDLISLPTLVYFFVLFVSFRAFRLR